ncbi:MAG: bifunctional phosphoribosylaminoimidazolecarboxamide formyltransferase/IMP cyclohydrolase [Spirochaetaceae bacterium]|jgi:phosphoribosylaminoimidazolecarboxamide formyltransferase/IMP cyclohydrolase|nr:bifunctional phosphoribosylaminoimidazolecarboxamide formyltransferase/IMP cyclohydrolase [Spirochaetaceae bacterium]
MKRQALISVFNKEGILDFASFLLDSGWELLSTGGTAKHLRENKISVRDVSEITGFPECLDGRVKTLHPAIHAGLLARRGEKTHMDTLSALGLTTIDLVCVNLYPFFEKVQAGLSLEETVEFIDIGGPTMLRSAAKNYQDVIVLTDPADYSEVRAAIEAGKVPHDFRKRLAGKVFELTSAYDAAIARYLLELDLPEQDARNKTYPLFWPLSLKKNQELRYGENGHQSAALYLNAGTRGALAGMEQLNGKELGYNNIRDLDLAWKSACAFGFPPENRPPLGKAELAGLGIPEDNAPLACCVAVKHNTPCGAAQAATLLEAYEKTYVCDPVSIYGGIVATTVSVDAETAEKLAGLFLEIVVAPDFDTEALAILKKKKNLRVLKARLAPADARECTAVDGGLLVQETDKRLLEKWDLVTKAAPDAADIADLIFGMRIVSYVKSNAIVVVKDRAAIGIGGGQTNRIWAAEQALSRAGAALKAAGENPALRGTAISDGKGPRVLASDAFFPFSDVVEAAAAQGIKTIIQPGGSIRDKDSIEACNSLGLAMVFTGTRHFKH